ncbi:hypothetical protein BGZ61DRAFT_486522 [Ilyonectria robusta]|uniref:uncharacterized protein n=1 Tax=Ilyonectria robusta TaxID=1079257 RepID=UPI001E8DEAAE|nr:uncharacterized protein BGZ61DRAFT_486522 [Ilyonectria robusta]KAH8656746.1 hypothetical protein BGZ61DRAFT_486522 [Ilyonectria robusta]
MYKSITGGPNGLGTSGRKHQGKELGIGPVDWIEWEEHVTGLTTWRPQGRRPGQPPLGRGLGKVPPWRNQWEEMEPAKSDWGKINDDRIDSVPVSLEQKRLPPSSSPEASSPRCSPKPESSGNAPSSPYKSSSPSLSTPDRHTLSYLSKGTASSLVEDWYHTDLNDKFVALHKCLPPLSLESHQQEMKETDSEADEQDQAFLEKALPRSTPQRNPSKTMILKRATDYIMELDQRNKSLLQEKMELQSRLTPLITAPDTPSQLQHLQPWLCEESEEGEEKAKEGEVLGLSHTNSDMKDF